jgi:type III restriction enzyme
VKISLFDFQAAAAEKVVTLLKVARSTGALTGMPQAVVLSAPTGAGKTVIATSAIEAFVTGNEEHPADPAAAFLWVTDQPALNRQTIRKMLEVSSGLTELDLHEVQSHFSEERLAPGNVYFINTQKLAKTGLLARRDDDHPFGFWDTVRNTIEAPDVRLYVVIDEAHRGAGETEDSDVIPIMQRFLSGFTSEDGEYPPAPVVLGISATPQRFQALLEGGSHGQHPVIVPAADVRASGLIKDRIHVVIPPDVSRTDEMSLLRSATREWMRAWDDWAQYQADYGGRTVKPILVVQVADAASDQELSATDLDAAISAVREVADDRVADDRAFAHAFGSQLDEEVGGRALRYLAPADIDRDPDVRVVLFKTSLNQGWDCPRAEVMMSFRRHGDATLIAQLVGRTVRTPLARRITERDELNSVELFLPYFDEQTVAAVRDNLQGLVPADTDTDVVPPVRLVRAANFQNVFDALEKVPTYAVPRVRKTKQTRRAMALAGLLDQHEVTTDCVGETEARLTKVLIDAHAGRAADPGFLASVAQGGVIAVLVRAYDPYGAEIGLDDERREIEASPDRADRLFQYAGRVFGASLHKPYWRARFAADGKGVLTRAKLEAAVLASDAAVVAELEKRARGVVDELLRRHGSEINALDPAAVADIDRLRGLADQPVEGPLALPDSIEVRRAAAAAPARHAYVEASTDEAPIGLGTWERDALLGASADSGFLGWLRNFDRRPYSVTVPYTMAGEHRPLFPDLLTVRSEGQGVVVDLLDPHNPQLEDAVHKAKGLAEYARKHGHLFGRIELIIKEGNALKRIDLQDSATRQQVFDINSNDALKQLYA